MSDGSIKVNCPQCSSKLSIKEELRDKKIACPKCQYKFKLSFSVTNGDMSSIVQANIETRELAGSRWKADDSIIEANVDETEPMGSGKSASASNVQSNSGSLSSNSADEVDWGASHKTHVRQFRRKYGGLSRAQFYRLARGSYQPLSDRDEILQSTGIFLVILSILTALLPLFDLKLAEFATAGPLPVILSISTAVVGMFMVVIAQRQNPVMALGLGLGMLLMFVVAYIGIYDFFGEQNPFRLGERKNGQASVEIADEDDIDVDNRAQAPVIVVGEDEAANAQQQISDLDSGIITETTTGRDNPGNRPNIGVAEIHRRMDPASNERQPVNPRNVEIPDDFNPEDDRFAPDNFGIPKMRDDAIVKETGDLLAESDEESNAPKEEQRSEQSYEIELRNRIRKITTETLRNGVPQSDEFSNKYLMDIAGTVTTMGSARMTENPVIGFDYLVRGGVLITEIIPISSLSKFPNSVSSAGGEKLRGLTCHFRNKELVGVQALFEIKGRDSLAAGNWAGKPVPVGEAGNTINSDGRDIRGMCIFKNDKNKIVGLGIVFEK